MLVSAKIRNIQIQANITPREAASMACLALHALMHIGNGPIVRVRPLDEEARTTYTWPQSDDEGPYEDFRTKTKVTFSIV